jgi:MoaA/NifB/PqqE/SkfB family radical SAM enzyme
MKKGTKVGFIVSVNDEDIGNIDKIAKHLKSLGCDISNILAFSGIITGKVLSSQPLSNLKIAGVKHIELERKVSAI